MVLNVVGVRGAAEQPGRNDPCPCGSGRKAKRCHMAPGGPPDGTPVLLGGAVTSAPGVPWKGERGEVVVYLDAGAGDAIHAMRHVDLVEGESKRAWWVVRPSMERLFKRSFPHIERVTSEHPVVTTPWRTTTLELIALAAQNKSPGRAAPYLKADRFNRAPVVHHGGDFFGSILNVRPPGRKLRMGLCARGDATQPFDRWRSVHDEAQLSPLLSLADVEWVRLDKTGRFRDWDHTAAVVSDLVAVVSVDTGVAHLAGALGIRLVMLDRAPGEGDPGPDDRWQPGFLQPGPLYPRSTVLRQAARGAWRDVASRAAAEVRALI